MDRDKITGIVLVFLNLILIVFCLVQYIKADKISPRFLLEATDIVYTPGMDQTELVQGITANDNRDGDVTDRIVIEKITEKRDEKKAVVYYAVCDQAGNVAKLSKLFYGEYPETEIGTAEDESESRSGGQDREEDAGRSDMTGEPEQEETGQDSGEGEEAASGDGAETEDGEDIDSAQETAEEEDQEAEEREDAAEDALEENEEENRAEATEPDRTGEQNTNGAGAPELVLGSSEITIDAGTNPPWTEIITTLRDDKDNYETLYYNLHVSQFNRSRPGSYPVTIYVEDSDGNRSQEVPFTIIVR